VFSASLLLLLDGAEHLRALRLIMPPFLGERMVAYASIMRSITEDVIATMPVGRPVALHPYTQRITLEIILRAIFGLRAGSDLDDLRDALTRLLDRQSSIVGTVGTLPPFRHQALGLSPWAGFVRDRARADELIHRQIARRRAEASRAGDAGDDVLALLLAARDEEGKPMTDGELRDELMTLLAAGHETTATALCWAFDLVLADRRVHGALTEEIRGAAHGDAPDGRALAKLEYLDATIRESLRLQPVIPAVGRKVRARVEIAGRVLEPGVQLVPIAYLTHRRPDVYTDPLSFKPERFLGAKPNPYAWYPFGGGVRRCLGMAFALYEMKVVMATILARLRLRKARPEREPVKLRSFTHAPAHGGQVVVEARLGARPPARAVPLPVAI
jgi:cytochrome P450